MRKREVVCSSEVTGSGADASGGRTQGMGVHSPGQLWGQAGGTPPASGSLRRPWPQGGSPQSRPPLCLKSPSAFFHFEGPLSLDLEPT